MKAMKKRFGPLSFCLILLLVVYGCAPPTSGGDGGGDSSSSPSSSQQKATLSGTLLLPDGILPKMGRVMYALLSGDALPGATVDLLDSDENLIATTVSNVAGEYTFSDVDPGINYIIHAYIGNINLYNIIPFVDDSDVDAGQMDAASTALYLLAEYYVDTTNDINGFDEIEPGSLQAYLELDTTLVDSVVAALGAGDVAASGDVINEYMDTTMISMQATSAENPAVSITTNIDNLDGGDEFYVYVNVAFMQNLYGAAFDLEYDSTIIQVKDSNGSSAGIQPTYSQGDFFVADESTLLIDFEEGNQGKLVVGISKNHDVVTTGNSGSGNLLRLTFNALNTTGTTSISFGSTSVLTDPNLDEILTNSWLNVSKQITVQ